MVGVKMDKLVNMIKNVNNLSELENIGDINTNFLIYAIVKSGKYELLKANNIRLNIDDIPTLEKIIDLLLSDEDIIYYMHKNSFSFSKEELNIMFSIVFQKYQYSYKCDCFFRNFFGNKDELNTFIKDHEQFFEKYINEKKQGVSYALKDCENFIKIILIGNHFELVSDIENYSISNLKLLVQLLKNNIKLPYYIGNDRFAQHLFELKSNLDLNEFVILLDLLKEKNVYSRKVRDSKNTSFSILVCENIEYLIDVVSKTGLIPKCLVESSTFRDECIKRNRIDLAVKCILPSDIMQNDFLINSYCNELKIDPSDFQRKIKWVLEYYEKNNNIFNTFLATSLKDNVFNLNQEHFERFINDVEVQMSIDKLSDREKRVLSKILNIYNYREYDITPMVINVINNINNYQKLIDSLDIENILESDLRELVRVLQLSNNQYQINNINLLQDYTKLKKQFFVSNHSNNLISNKDNLLKALFNIDLKEAKYINYKYCYDNDDNNVLEKLKNSELPQQTYNYLSIINRIVECINQDELSTFYNNINEISVYDLEIPFESYLRAQYTQLYSQSLYRINERSQIYGPKDSILNEIKYNGKNIQVCIPRANFNFLVHCVGSCSLASDVTDSNYRNDWFNRPQLQDHFVACSYFDEKGIYSIRSQGSIILGFDTLENSSILGMGNTDIDSIGRYANAYNGSRELQEENGSRARYFVPSEILKTINNGYNEIVIERRNTDKSINDELNRKPDYIIMMADSIAQDNFNCLETLYQSRLSFISQEDQKAIIKIGDSRNIKKLLTKYNDVILRIENNSDISLDEIINNYVDLIMKSKYYEDCLKASSEFNIPLIILDKTYYFNKMLFESGLYDDETLSVISSFYSKTDESKKKQMFNMVAKGEDVTKVMKSNENRKFILGI